MMGQLHWFWLAMTAAVLVWYSVITVYVAIRGAFDIKEMLGNLGRLREEQEESGSSADYAEND